MNYTLSNATLKELARPSPAAQGLAAYLGQICHVPPTGSLVICVHVVIVRLRDNRRTKWGSTYPPRWPGGVEFEDGRML